MKHTGYILFIIISSSCLSATNGWKELDLNAFKISIPEQWNYKKEQGIDSFVGQIVGPKSSLSFDYSGMGYANGLIQTEREYIKRNEWNRGYFYKVGVTYTSDLNVKNEIIAQMKKLGTKDSSLVHVEADPSYQTRVNVNPITLQQKTKFPKADYIAVLTYKDSSVTVPIELPDEIKSHYIKCDTTEHYIIKTIWPKIPGKGTTGIYIKSRSSSLNFNLHGVNLPHHEQELALKAFKTIKLNPK